MTKRVFFFIALSLSLLLGAVSAQASEGGGELMSAHVSLKDKASLQRGARLYFNYCSGCHSLHFMRYSRMAEDLGLTEKEVMNNLNFTGAKFQGHAIAAMPEADAAKWFGKAPPDLSLKVAEKGSDYVYSYLNSFYLDPERPVGWNNTVFPNASMPNPLWELQGLQVAEKGKAADGSEIVTGLKLEQPGRMSPEQFHAATRDLTAFLTYVSEPAALKRESMGIWVLLYLAAFTFLAYLLKHEYWKDVH
ncbi:cytochrome c1 [Oleiagrimonas soli]|uniref:Ubiquinol cytochrome C oxidoreductase n=1 Tax=Oleiagrimonas soli TaxID=1543381 RepID=A0A099CY11_9GAMM|nr:cytochrome c1 [Oleiagrimonas soli]KGI78654.1 ubiquinol cytochrome C oxidoreductase [Oleiagrimonas soli]MBB6184040.1 ubiquinol-cytochrome c reductase cytochrome c1 subunit [Oleiagrimonas soli]